MTFGITTRSRKKLFVEGYACVISDEISDTFRKPVSLISPGA